MEVGALASVVLTSPVQTFRDFPSTLEDEGVPEALHEVPKRSWYFLTNYNWTSHPLMGPLSALIWL